MKKIIWFAGIVLLLIGCGRQKEGYFVNVDIAGVKDGKKVFLKTLDANNRFIDVDTAMVEFENFFFEGNSEAPLMHYIFVDGLQGNLPVIIENGNIAITAFKDSLNLSKIEGTKSNEEFAGYLSESRKIYMKLGELRTAYTTAARNKDNEAMAELRNTFAEVQGEIKDYDFDFVTNNPNSYISTLVLERILDTKSQPAEKIQSLYDAFPEELKNSVSGKSIAKKLSALGATEIGSIAPNFSAKTPEDSDLALNDVIGKVTIIDFWASWCKPCRAENPNVVAMYNRLHDKGLNIIGVSLDNDRNKWIKAIEDDQLSWNHVSNLKAWKDPIARQYNVTAIPQTFILDENGAIVDTNLRGEALESRVKELLGE